MDKEVMDKLMEIKKLYEAGILTKEEMEAEKAKVLYPPGTTDKQDEPVVEEKSQDNNGSVNKTFLWVAIAVMVILLIVLVAASNKSNDNNESPSYNEEYVDVDSWTIDDNPESFDIGTGNNDINY